MPRVRKRNLRGPRLGSVLWILASLPVAAELREIRPGDSFEAAAEALRPGDVLVVHAGTYADSGRLSLGVRATAESPVVIRAADGEARPVITRPAGAAVENTINIEGATHLTIRGLEITGNGGDGVKIVGGAAHVTLDDLDIHDVDVGINFRDSSRLTITRNHIHRTGINGGTGEGMYVGCHAGDCAVRESRIEGNWVHDTLRGTQGDGIEIKLGSHSNVVRDNVVHDTRYPCILLYGTAGNPRNLVEGNALWNCGDSAIQAAADAIIRNNLLLDNPGNGFNSQDHNGVTPANLEFVHNTIVGGNPCLRMNNWSGKPGLLFANNAVYCPSGNFRIAALDGVAVEGNVVFPATSQLPVGGFRVGREPALDLLAPAARNVYPTADSTLLDAGVAARRAEWDFDGTPRGIPPDAGAYERTTAGNPAWVPAPGFKGSRPSAVEPPAAPTNLQAE